MDSIFCLVLSFITWDFDPALFNIDGFEVRWYGAFFATAFLVGHYILSRAFKIENKSREDADALTIMTILCTVIGARLGHILFYDPHYYFIDIFERYFTASSGDPTVVRAPQSFFEAFYKTFIRIINVREGGLASHGAAAGIITAILLYIRKRKDQSFVWVADRLALTVPSGAVFVRLGNFANSEICGHITNVPWAIEYLQAQGSDCAGGPRHPTQLYEALSYFIIMIITFVIYFRYKSKTPKGMIVGILLSLLFTARFLIEFVKENQESYQNTLPINTGQILSLPLIIMGVVLLIRAVKSKNLEENKEILPEPEDSSEQKL